MNKKVEVYKERRQLLIDALKSGEYKQTKNTLEDINGFCCLGVACKVAQKNGVKVSFNKMGELKGTVLESQKEVKNWYGFDNYNPDFYFNDTHRVLAELNDSGQYTFKQIADIIDSNPKGLWKKGTC